MGFELKGEEEEERMGKSDAKEDARTKERMYK